MDRLARALPAVAILAVVSMLVAHALTWVTVERAADAADRGEVEALARGIELALRTSGGPPSKADLEEVLQANAERGLVYIAASAREGDRSAGQPIDAGPPIPGLTRHGAYIRGVFELPPPGRGGPPAKARSPGPGPHAAEHRPRLVLDVRPSLGAQLYKDSRATAVAATLAAILFVVLAVVLRRSQLAHDAVMQHRARERRLAALGEMASVLSHEIRNPLASLKGHAQLLGETLSGDEKSQKKIGRIVTEAERLERLTTELLDFVGTAKLEKEPVDLVALVRRAADAVLEGSFELRAPDAPAIVHVDEARIYQLLLNVLRNAAQAAPAVPVEVEVTVARDSIVVRVRDRGPGLPPGQERRVFDPFFTTRTKGTGLGLSIAQQIVERHDGTLEAQNAEGGGAAFTIVLPKGRE